MLSKKAIITVVMLVGIVVVWLLSDQGCRSRFNLAPPSPDTGEVVAEQGDDQGESPNSDAELMVDQTMGDSQDLLAGPSEFGVYVDRDWRQALTLINLDPLSRAVEETSTEDYRRVGQRCEVFVYPASRAMLGSTGVLEVYPIDQFDGWIMVDFMNTEPTADGEMARFVLTFPGPGRCAIGMNYQGWVMLQAE